MSKFPGIDSAHVAQYKQLVQTITALETEQVDAQWKRIFSDWTAAKDKLETAEATLQNAETGLAKETKKVDGYAKDGMFDGCLGGCWKSYKASRHEKHSQQLKTKVVEVEALQQAMGGYKGIFLKHDTEKAALEPKYNQLTTSRSERDSLVSAVMASTMWSQDAKAKAWMDDAAAKSMEAAQVEQQIALLSQSQETLRSAEQQFTTSVHLMTQLAQSPKDAPAAFADVYQANEAMKGGAKAMEQAVTGLPNAQATGFPVDLMQKVGNGMLGSISLDTLANHATLKQALMDPLEVVGEHMLGMASKENSVLTAQLSENNGKLVSLKQSVDGINTELNKYKTEQFAAATSA